MTAAVRCACCRSPRPAAEVYERIPRSGEWFCKDSAGCRRRMAGIGDPVGEVAAAPPPAAVGATCSVCATAGSVYERTPGVYVCLDRAACAERSVEAQYLTAWSDSSPDRLISAADMRAMAAAAPPQVPPERTELTPDELGVLAWQETQGRRAGGTSATTVA